MDVGTLVVKKGKQATDLKPREDEAPQATTSSEKHVEFVPKRTFGMIDLRGATPATSPTIRESGMSQEGGLLKEVDEAEKMTATLNEVRETETRLLAFNKEEERRRLNAEKVSSKKCGPCSIL